MKWRIEYSKRINDKKFKHKYAKDKKEALKKMKKDLKQNPNVEAELCKVYKKRPKDRPEGSWIVEWGGEYIDFDEGCKKYEFDVEKDKVKEKY